MRGLGTWSAAALVLIFSTGNGEAQEQGAAISWSGPYVGIHAGGTRSHSDLGYVLTPGTNPIYVTTYQEMISATGPSSDHGTSFVGGIQLGYSFQTSNAIFGIEADVSSLDVSDTRQRTFSHPSYPGFPFTHRQSVSADWMSTVRARLGFAYAANAYLYATGGLAVAEISHSYSFDEPGEGFSSSARSSDAKLGWVVGAGTEFALDRNWAIRAEYLRTEFGDVRTAETQLVEQQPAYNTTFRSSANLVLQTFRAGLSYRF